MEQMCSMRENGNMRIVCPIMACSAMYSQGVNINPMMGAMPACMNYLYMNKTRGNNSMYEQVPLHIGYPCYNRNDYMYSPNLFYMKMKSVPIEEIID
ncbi:hypothetical protein M2651_08130 [Clostridium sp. SYSU_GA19001]|uniref:hypothetical protein n=1 Tax=Clostridium caldaquaticum TaxID=2940653 RepID=UPI0020776BC0|nr:hypothetical protein [Clostridium caldaquaticum]MCM8710992.1 hypothetical protein [Clostridium caldaquaticum]